MYTALLALGIFVALLNILCTSNNLTIKTILRVVTIIMAIVMVIVGILQY